MDVLNDSQKWEIPIGLVNLIICYMTKKDKISFYHAFTLKGCPCRCCCKNAKFKKIKTLQREIDLMSDILDSLKKFRESIPN